MIVNMLIIIKILDIRKIKTNTIGNKGVGQSIGGNALSPQRLLYHSYQDYPIIHMYPMCVAQSATRGTVKSELGQ